LNRAGTPHEARRPSRRILRTGPGATCWPAPVPGRAADGSAGVSARTWGPQGHVAPGHAGAAGERLGLDGHTHAAGVKGIVAGLGRPGMADGQAGRGGAWPRHGPD
jgi:hypothetical protein